MNIHEGKGYERYGKLLKESEYLEFIYARPLCV